MTVSLHNDVPDAALAYIRDNCDKMIACAGAPASYAEATTPPAGGKALADAAMSSGDFTIGDGDTDGRKITWTSKPGTAVDDAGNCDHIAFVDTGNSKLLLVVPGTATVALSTGGGETVTIEGGSYTLRDPSVV